MSRDDLKVIVCGYSQHGKDTLCEHLRDRHGLAYESSSRVACPDVYRLSATLRAQFCGPEQAWQHRNDSKELQAIWHDAICEINKNDKTTMARKIFSEFPVYCGMREPGELQACRDQGICDLSIWVDASERKPPQHKSSCGITAGDCDAILQNNGEVREMIEKADRLFNLIG